VVRIVATVIDGQENGAVSYDDYADDDLFEFRFVCVVAMILGVSLLVSRAVLDFGLWSVVLGVILISAAGPFVFDFFSEHVSMPLDRLVRGFGFAMPGIGLILISEIARASSDLKPELRAIWDFAAVVAWVWSVAFFGSALIRFLWLRGSGAGLVWYQGNEDDSAGWYGRPGWTSYEWTSLIVAIISGGGSIAAVVIELAK
jgi:hypothetical protein